MSEWCIGVIGGSGLYDIDSLTQFKEHDIDTPFGEPSHKIVSGRFEDKKVAFLARHGEGHRLGPTEVNYRANIFALKKLGCTDIISFSACGSLREDLAPGNFLVVDQYIDRTFARSKSFFGKGLVAHVSMADPVCSRLSQYLLEAGLKNSLTISKGGTYVAIEGPQFSTRAESFLYRSWNCDVIGMTNMPEAKLAREASLPYAAVAMVTDFDCWRDQSDDVEVTNVLEVLHKNAQKAKTLLELFLRSLPEKRTDSPQQIETTIERSLVTNPDHWDQNLVKKLAPLLPK